MLLDSKKCDYFVLKWTAWTLAIINSLCVQKESVFLYWEMICLRSSALQPSYWHPISATYRCSQKCTCYLLGLETIQLHCGTLGLNSFQSVAVLYKLLNLSQLPTLTFDNSAPKSSDLLTKTTVLDTSHSRHEDGSKRLKGLQDAWGFSQMIFKKKTAA